MEDFAKAFKAQLITKEFRADRLKVYYYMSAVSIPMLRSDGYYHKRGLVMVKGEVVGSGRASQYRFEADD